MDTEITTALIGIGATIVGTILGWVLNSISQMGRLRIYVCEWKEIYEKRDEMCCMIPCNNIDEAEYYRGELSLNIYNSSRDTKAMRNIRLVYINGKQELFSVVPKDDSTKKTFSSYVHYDDISVINIPGRNVLSITIHTSSNRGDEMWNYINDSTKIIMSYSNEKDKKRKLVVK